ncbi:MAG TPA: nuclear transport factor 2 family protein [Casimicrobiaceae bacterium]|nr:nuclear transport factor 2 family protein [Casimicrobiaceae bacterium]
MNVRSNGRRIVACVVLIFSLASLLLGSVAAASADESAEITRTVSTMLEALAGDDFDKFHAVTADDFYAFDNGKRFVGDELIMLIKKLHAAGNVYVWHVTEPQVSRANDVAWVTYVNKGSITDAGGRKDVTWLESSVLQKEHGQWRIRFFHSTRAQ